MSDLRNFCDVAMCILWITTYTLVLIGTIKTKYPLISPLCQAIIAPFEFTMALPLLLSGTINYYTASYFYWTIIEIAIIVFNIKSGFIKRKYAGLYLGLIATITAIMLYFVIIREQILLFSFLNTFVGMIFWFVHITKKDYPMVPITLIIFVSKFIADGFAAIIYFGNGTKVTDLLSISLFVLEFAFIPVYFWRVLQRKIHKK